MECFSFQKNGPWLECVFSQCFVFHCKNKLFGAFVRPISSPNCTWEWLVISTRPTPFWGSILTSFNGHKGIQKVTKSTSELALFVTQNHTFFRHHFGNPFFVKNLKKWGEANCTLCRLSQARCSHMACATTLLQC